MRIKYFDFLRWKVITVDLQSFFLAKLTRYERREITREIAKCVTGKLVRTTESVRKSNAKHKRKRMRKQRERGGGGGGRGRWHLLLKRC